MRTDILTEHATVTYVPQMRGKVTYAQPATIVLVAIAQQLNARFPEVHFSYEGNEDGSISISVHDIDFYFSERFKSFLDSLAESLTMDQYMGLDFLPAEKDAQRLPTRQVLVTASAVAQPVCDESMSATCVSVLSGSNWVILAPKLLSKAA